MSDGDLISKTRAASYWLFGSHIFIQGISWLITIYVARLLAPEDYGLFGMASLVISFLVMFNEMGVSEAIIQKKEISAIQLSSCFWAVLVLNMIFYIILYGLAPIVARFFDETQLDKLIKVVSITVLVGGLYKIPMSLLTKDLDFRSRAIAQIASRLFGGFTTLTLAYWGYGVWSLIIGFIVDDSIKLLFFFGKARWWPRVEFSFREMKSLMSFGYKISFSRFLKYLYSNADYLCAGKFLGKAALGYYTFAFQLVSLPQEKFVSIAGQVLFPFFSKIQNDNTSLKYYFLKANRLLSLVVFPVFVGAFIVAEEGVAFFLTEKWLPILLPFRALCLVGILRSLDVVRARITIGVGRPDIELLNNILMGMFLPGAFFIGVFYGLKGLSYAWLIAYPPLFLFMMSRTIRLINLKFDEFLKSFIPALVPTTIMFVVVGLLKLSNLITLTLGVRLFIFISAGTGIFMVITLLFYKGIITEFMTSLKG